MVDEDAEEEEEEVEMGVEEDVLERGEALEVEVAAPMFMPTIGIA